MRTATTVAAEGLGLHADVGQLNAGMLADLIVLDANPLDDIRNTNTVRYVMKTASCSTATTST